MEQYLRREPEDLVNVGLLPNAWRRHRLERAPRRRMDPHS